MDVTAEQARMLAFVIAEFIRRRQITGQPIPDRVRGLLRAVSAHGTAEPVAPQESPADLIDSEQAAQICGCSSRRIRRIAADLDGEQIAGRWIFHRHNVIEYARNKKEAA
ncbi:MAG: hypothetical protein WBA05_17940 [Gordonia sp. (in: high G+C Gram-positive bacteria)]|uniref:hypothetical protein n=1 Tax=Gordonia sp. (in: high G+C Gram-positive bacteria) TaxID=84139 RepID=UPI003C7770CF